MTDILNTITGAIGSFFDTPAVKLTFEAVGVYYLILWLASAYWAFRDMQQRSENPILPYLAAALIVLFNVFFPFGIIVYRIIRPHEKIGEVYERNLAEEALLAEVESVRSCPTCHRRVHDEWIICPTCRTRLNRVCASCGRLVGLDWSLCAWCGRDFERTERPSLEPVQGYADRDRLDDPVTSVTTATRPPRSSQTRPASRSAADRTSAAGPLSEP
jgi:RNA polymerase subunit RPABC4/transcription elongation factor Spt4